MVQRIIFCLCIFIIGCATIFLFYFLKKRSFKLILQSSEYRELMVVVVISTITFLIIQHFFFDDAGFVLRYLDNFRAGYWFRYNIQDQPVYGISGFIHGLLCGILCRTHLAAPEQALWFSNFTGFVLSCSFLFYIFKILIKETWKAWLCWIVAISTAKMYLSVASCGLETSLHISLLLGAIYFMFKHKTRIFFLFAALFIISKLDAVPPTIVLLVCSIIWNHKYVTTKKLLTDLAIGFVFPLSIGLLIIQLIFGSILPQSAFAKLYYHPHPDQHWFPFLEYFIKNTFRILLLVIFFIMGCFHIGESVMKKKLKYLVHFTFGGMFLSLLFLYYWYNPAERMMWYYAMPELLFNIQVIYSSYYITHYILKKKILSKIWMYSLVVLAGILWIMVYNGFVFLNKKIKPIEEERLKIGILLGEISQPSDVLLAHHGHIARYFKGYVIDGSGLNSKVATDYKRDIDLIIKQRSPSYMIHHSMRSVIDIYNKYNYELVGIYRDVEVDGYLPWILVKKTSDHRKHQLKMEETFVSQDSPVILVNTYNVKEKFLHIGATRSSRNLGVRCDLFKNGIKQSSLTVEIPAISSNQHQPSSLISDLKIDISGIDSVVLTSRGNEWRISHPIYELIE